MDRFKFRVWDSLSKKWLHGLKSHQGCSLFGECMLLGGWLSEVSIEDHDNLIIEQCTGKKIANTLIFEGDIGRHWNYFYQRFDYFVMKWLDNGPNALFAWVQTKAPTLTYKPLHKFTLSERCIREGACEMMELCGTIHENPELLETKS